MPGVFSWSCSSPIRRSIASGVDGSSSAPAAPRDLGGFPAARASTALAAWVGFVRSVTGISLPLTLTVSSPRAKVSPLPISPCFSFISRSRRIGSIWALTLARL